MKLSPLLAVTALLLAVISCAHQREGELAPPDAHFVNEVKPLLERRCLPCHDGRTLAGRFSLASRATAFQPDPGGPFIVPGHPGKSKLLTVVLAPESHPQAMPPTGHGLSEVEILVLEEWIRRGAPWPSGRRGRLESAPGAEPRSVDASPRYYRTFA